MSQSVDWRRLKEFVTLDNSTSFLSLLAEYLQSGNKQFGVLQKSLRTECFQQVGPEAARQFVCDALLSVLTQADLPGGNAAVAHLLLEALPVQKGVFRPPATASCLFAQCCCAEHARLAVKVAQAFSVQWEDVEDQQQCKEFMQVLLNEKSLYTPAVGLLLHFPELQQGTDISQALKGLVEDGQLGLAQRWADTLPHSFQIGLINHCVNVDRLKEAVKLVRHLKLQQTFPDIDEVYKQRTLARLLEKEQWAVAATYAGQDKSCQEQVVRAMALAGQLAQADEVREQFGLSKDVLDIDSTEADAQKAAAAEAYLPLRLLASSVLFVDSEAMVSRARDILQCVTMVGLDVEWKPNTSGEQNPASILQVATHSQVLLFDMLKLQESQALDTCLTSLLQSKSIVKLGCRLSDDVSKLHRSYPGMQAFQQALALLDLTGPWSLYMQTYNSQELQGRRRGTLVGLSHMAHSLLGKPLNKAMQMSDWERRPLSSKQTEYAALDAFVLLELYDAIAKPGQGLTQQQLEPFLYSFTDQKRQRTGSIMSSASDAKQPSTSDQQHKQHDPQPDACSSVEHSSPPDQNDSAETANGNLCPADQLKSLQNSSLGGPVSTSAQVQAPRSVQPQVPLATKPEGQAIALSAGSPLQQCLHRHGLEGAVKSFPSGAGSLATAASAASALGVSQRQIANSLAFVADIPTASQQCTPVVLVLRGNHRVDTRKAMPFTLQNHAHYLLLSRRRCRLGFVPARWPACCVSPHAVLPQHLCLACLLHGFWLDSSKSLVADHLGCSRRALKAASPEHCQSIFGYLPGMLPPCGHACQATVLVDEGLQQPQIDVSAFPAANSSSSSIRKEQREPAESLQCVLSQPRQMQEQPSLPENSASELQSHIPIGLLHQSVPGQGPKGMTVSGLQDECQQPGAQADAAAALLYCGAGLPSAYLAITFDQLLLLSMGRSVDLVQDSASSAGSCSHHAGQIQHMGRTDAAACTFLLDSMCGRLCRWLRCVGVDTELLDADVQRSQVALLSDQASRQGRVFLTRDHKLAEQRGLSAVYLLACDDAKQQFQDIQKRFGIRVDKKKLLSRCSQCNSAAIRRVEQAEIQHVVDAKVFKHVNRFWQCQDCEKVFWVGPKSDAAVQNILGMMLDEQLP